MSGDHAPISNINGAIDFINNSKSKNTKIILYGNENIIKNNLKLINRYNNRLSYKITKSIVNMKDKPSFAFKHKRDSSLITIIDDLNNKNVNAAISAGNTGALLTSSLLILGKIKGIKRPALTPFIPIKNSGFILCDAGANTDTKPQHLVQFALMASAYMKHLENRPNPRVALINIGLEENKGNELAINTYPLLKNHIHNYIGNIESRYLLDGKADIVICDGFTGNIVLKLSEGIISHLMGWIQEQVKAHVTDKDLSSIYQHIFEDIATTLDHEEHGATPLLGINGVIMKCHGSSTARGIKNSLIATQKTVKNNLIKDIATILSKHNNIFDDNTKISESNPV